MNVCHFALIVTAFLLHDCLPSCSHDDSFLASWIFTVTIPWWQPSCLLHDWLLAPIYYKDFLASIISAVLLPWWRLSCFMNVCHYCTVATFLHSSWLISSSLTCKWIPPVSASCWDTMQRVSTLPVKWVCHWCTKNQTARQSDRQQRARNDVITSGSLDRRLSRCTPNVFFVITIRVRNSCPRKGFKLTSFRRPDQMTS